MRKVLFILILTAALLLAVPALAQTFTFDDVYLSLDIPSGYTVITPETAQANAQLLLAKGYNASEVPEIFAAEGILLQAWNASADMCFELTALRDPDAERFFDLDQQTPADRGAYRKEHLSGESYELLGLKYSSAEWKKTSQYGRVLVLKYTQSEGGSILYRGYARKAIRNGYTIQFNMKVYDRLPKAADSKALDKIMDTVSFTQVLPLPATAIEKVTFTSIPPVETNTDTFTVEGTGEPGLQIVGALARPGAGSTEVLTATINKKGNFSMPVKLPAEGVYVMTLTILNGETVVQTADDFEIITYDRSLLPVNIINAVSSTITSDKTIISGTSVKGAKVQLTYGDTNKQMTVGADKAFRFSVDTSTEGIYSFTLSVSKKGMDTRSFQFSGTRVFTEDERRSAIKREAVKPAYKVLVSKINGYDGRVMVYTPYVTEIHQDGPDWLLTMAMTRTKGGVYKEFIVVSTSEEPNLTIGTAYKMYLRCVGMYTVLSEGGKETQYPSFELLFTE